MILSDEYQTPKKYIKAAIEVMESIDLDPACSNENADRIINITNRFTPKLKNATIENPQCNPLEYYTKEQNGLNRKWFGNIWLNPPYSKPNLTYWTLKIIKDRQDFNQLIYLIPSYTSEKWYHYCLKTAQAFCLPNHRIEFLINGKIKDSPRFANTFFYFGESPIKFCEVFSQFGKAILIN